MRTRPILAAAALLLAAGLAAVTYQAVSQTDEPLRIGTHNVHDDEQPVLQRH